FGQCLRLFYGAIKGNEQIRFLAVTGVTRLKDVSVLSAGSDIEDLSYDHAYSQMIGFTRDEIKRFYGNYLRLGVSYEQGIKPEEVSEAQLDEFLDRMAYHYDGFCFDEFYKSKVFSTWSVNKFLSALERRGQVEFGDYWYDAAPVPPIIENYLKSDSVDLESFAKDRVLVPFEEFRSPTSLITMHPCVLMYQSGYLTLKAPLKRNLDVTLGFANREVSSALCSLISMKFLKHNVSPYLPGSSTDYVLEKGTPLQIIDHLNTLLAAVVYDHYPIKEESMLRLLFEFYCKGAELEVRAEQHNSKGRSDLIVVCKERCLVLELKFSQDGSDAQALLDEAIEQIKARDYGREETLHGQMLLRIAAVFNAAAKERRITLWQELSES
ncbi:MAG: AAA family ATPase, partial [Succinivibrio sp.]|nr:AAA family ATPase [Succinivibrio sp.]